MTKDIVKVDYIPFAGGQLVATQLDDQAQVFLKPLIDSLGVDYGNQLKKLKTKSWAKTRMVLVTTQLPGDTQARQYVVVPAKVALMLLATIDENRVAEHVRPGLILLQDEIADIVEAYYTKNIVINKKKITLEQAEQGRSELDEIVVARQVERVDYRNVTRALSQGGAINKDYAQVQDTLYLGLFGVTARTLVRTRNQQTGERLKRGTAGGLTAASKKVAKNYLTVQELDQLNAAVLMMTSTLAIRFPGGTASHDDIKACAIWVASQATAGRRQLEMAA